MKLAVCLLAAPVAGLVAPAAPARTATVLNAEMSKALPFLTAPKGLKGYIGEEAGFDPVGFAEIMDIKWMREAEIKHGRVAMLATIGYTYPEMPWFAQAFPGDAYSHSNPIKAALAVPPEAWAQVVLFCGGALAASFIIFALFALASRATSTSRRWRHVSPHRRDAPRRSRRRVSTRRCRQKLLSPIRCSDEARATPPPPLATPSRRPARPLTLFVYLSSRLGGFGRPIVRVEPLGAVEAHPLARDRVRAAGRVAALPAAHAQVRDGEAEVARERGREVVPAAGEVLEPDLGRGAPVRAVDEADLRASA